MLDVGTWLIMCLAIMPGATLEGCDSAIKPPVYGPETNALYLPIVCSDLEVGPFTFFFDVLDTEYTSCQFDIYNCDDFSSHEEAQAVFEYCMEATGVDVYDLDRDNDLKACERDWD